MGALIQVMDHETCGSGWFAINQQNKALWRPRWRHRSGDRIMRLFEGVAILMPPLVPEPTGNNRDQIRPIRDPDDQFLLHWLILFGMACRPAPTGLPARTVARRAVIRWPRSEGPGVRSNVVWAQRGDHLGGPLMHFGFPLEVLWEPAASC